MAMIVRGDCLSPRIGLDVAHEGAIDLEHVDRKVLQIRERRVARAEIIDRDLNTKRFQGAKFDQNSVRIFHDNAFGNFQPETSPPGPRLSQRFANESRQI